MKTGAHFSPCRRWRYLLWRQWDNSLPTATFVLMNPSTADEVNDDPTVAAQQVRVSYWPELGLPKVGAIVVANAFAWRETDSRKLPAGVAAGIDIIGPENDKFIVRACKLATIVIVGWGKPGHMLLNRGEQLLQLFAKHDIKVHALDVNKDGSPKHPLYIAHRKMPVPYFQWRKAA